MTFLEPRLERPLPKTLTFKAIAKGEGGVYLRLSPEQYSKLRRAVKKLTPVQVLEAVFRGVRDRPEQLTDNECGHSAQIMSGLPVIQPKYQIAAGQMLIALVDE